MKLISLVALFSVGLVFSLKALDIPITPTSDDVEAVLSRCKDRQGLTARVECFSAQFLGRPYNEAGPLGEGLASEYDPDPLYRFDSFDCTTFIETVMALAHSENFEEFKNHLLRLRYKDAKVSFVTRNNFPDVEWTTNNIADGYFFDQSTRILPDAPFAETQIEKRAWLEMMTETRLSAHYPMSAEKLAALRAEGAKLPLEEQVISSRFQYIPIAAALDSQTGEALLSRLPDLSVINIVRPNWDLKKYIGTNMNVGHQAFLIRIDGKLFMRHASSLGEKKVQDIAFTDYLKKFETSKVTKGFQVLELTK